MQITTAVYPMIGIMQMPPGFRYREVFRRGRPKHEKYDSFWIRHPPMSAGRWAKIFAPFDALYGFDERIAGKEVQYCERKILSEGEKEELNRKLTFLHSLTYNGREARKNAPAVTITCFEPCLDVESEWYGRGGQYREFNGTVLGVEADSLRIKTAEGETSIPLDNIQTGAKLIRNGKVYMIPREKQHEQARKAKLDYDPASGLKSFLDMSGE